MSGCSLGVPGNQLCHKNMFLNSFFRFGIGLKFGADTETNPVLICHGYMWLQLHSSINRSSIICLYSVLQNTHYLYTFSHKLKHFSLILHINQNKHEQVNKSHSSAWRHFLLAWVDRSSRPVVLWLRLLDNDWEKCCRLLSWQLGRPTSTLFLESCV